MNAALQKTIFHLTGKPNLAQVAKEELEALLNLYPYFAPLQIAYAAKLNTLDTHQANIQLQKTGLFCTNQKWLQYQLMDANSFEVQVTNNVVSNIEIPTIEAVKHMMDGVDGKEKNVAEPLVDEIVEEPIATETIPQNVHQSSNANEQQSHTYILEKPLVIEQVHEVDEVEKQEAKLSPNTFVLDVNIPEQQIANVENVEKSTNPLEQINSEKNEIVQIINEVEESVASKTIQPNEIESSVKQPNETINEQASEVAISVDNDIESPLPLNDIHAQIAKLKEEWHKPVEVDDKSLVFDVEPYYTIDYFASQGIKFDLAKEPKDMLTKKMLRFTDWLKRMKSSNEIIAENEDDDAQDIEAAILKIANVSNQPKEIVTETMAQVFEKQGKINKAVQLYIKLSFLNPDKTAYFATKIQELKGIKS